jgi:hypothetical protein
MLHTNREQCFEMMFFHLKMMNNIMMNNIREKNSIKGRISEYYAIFCFYSLPVCGLIAIPGIFLNWWMIHIGYYCVIVALLGIVCNVIWFLIFFITKKTCGNKNVLTIYDIGKVLFSSKRIFFNDTPDSQNAEELFWSADEFYVFLHIDNDKQIGLLQFSTSNNPASVNEIIEKQIPCVSCTVIVDSGEMYLISASPIKYIPSENSLLNSNVIQLTETSDLCTSLKIRLVYGDGDYRILYYVLSTEIGFIVEIIGGALELYSETLGAIIQGDVLSASSSPEK